MKLIREAQGVRYELFTMQAIDETAFTVAEAFSHYEPITIALDISSNEWMEFIKFLGLKAQKDELTIVARDLETEQVIGAMIADDFASELPLGKERLSDKFTSIFKLLDDLDSPYKLGKRISIGEYLHLFIIAVAHQYKEKKVAQNLIEICMENGMRKGYRTAVTEATGAISQHIFRNRFGFIDRFEIPYKIYTQKGRKIFESIEGHTGIILMDKNLV